MGLVENVGGFGIRGPSERRRTDRWFGEAGVRAEPPAECGGGIEPEGEGFPGIWGEEECESGEEVCVRYESA